MRRAGGISKVPLVLPEDARDVQIHGFHPAIRVAPMVLDGARGEAAPLGEKVVEGDKREGRLKVAAQVVSQSIRLNAGSWHAKFFATILSKPDCLAHTLKKL